MSNMIIRIAKIAYMIRHLVLGNYSNTSNPTNLITRIKQSMGINIYYTNSSLFDGFVKWNNKKNLPEITVSSQDTYYRQEFTIAHELGHLILHWYWLPHKSLDQTSKLQAKKQSNILSVMYRGYPGTSDNIIEKQADEFAGDFLMPAKGIKRLYSKLNVKDPDILKFDVSEHYHVSSDAAYIRLRNLEDREVL